MTSKRKDIDNEEVGFMYEFEGMSQQQIADYYGVTQQCIYFRLHPDKGKEYYEKNKEHIREQQKEYRQTDDVEDYLKEYMKEYRQSDKYKVANKIYQKPWRESEHGKIIIKEFWQSEKGKLSAKKHTYKQRERGFIPLNSHFKDGEWHHIDEEHVICIPEELHRSIWHNLKTGQGMEEINAISFGYITEEMFEKLMMEVCKIRNKFK